MKMVEVMKVTVMLVAIWAGLAAFMFVVLLLVASWIGADLPIRETALGSALASAVVLYLSANSKK